MISYSVEANHVDDSTFKFKGLSTDTKPTGSFEGKKIANASSFFEMDTQNVYFYDGATSDWLSQP